jgi:hypothetical protein
MTKRSDKQAAFDAAQAERLKTSESRKREYHRQYDAKRRAGTSPRLSQSHVRAGGPPEPFSQPEGYRQGEWVSRGDGALERPAGPLVARVEPCDEPGHLGTYVWLLVVHSWVEPADAIVRSGRAKSLHVAKAQALWAGYAMLMEWTRLLLVEDTSLDV